MSDLVRVMSPLETAEAKLLAAFFTEVLSEELARRGMNAEVRRSACEDGFELRLNFAWHGVLFIDAARLRDHGGARLQQAQDEARALVQAMTHSIAERMK